MARSAERVYRPGPNSVGFRTEDLNDKEIGWANKWRGSAFVRYFGRLVPICGLGSAALLQWLDAVTQFFPIARSRTRQFS